METETELNNDILTIKRKRQEAHPELTKLLSDMPVIKPAPQGEAVYKQTLTDYYNLLEGLFESYNSTLGDVTEIEA